MAELLNASEQRTMPELQRELTTPLLFLSSEDAGWEDLVVRAYHEPMEFEGWADPPTPDITLMMLTSGSMLIEQRRNNGLWKAVHFNQGDLNLKPEGGASSELRWKSLSPQPMQTLHILLSKELFTRTASEMADSDPDHLRLFGRSAFQDPLVAQIGLALWRELEQPTVAGKLYAQTAAQMLTVHLLRHYTSPAPQITEPMRGLSIRQVSQVVDFVLSHLGEDLSLPTLAQQTGFSPYHFARMFRLATGESPHQFVLRQRIEHAKNLLREADLSLTQVALESGFANQSHLTQAFKRYLGLTPATYRQDNKIRAHFC